MTLFRFIGALLAWLAIGTMHSLSRFIDMKKHDPNTLFSLTDTFLYMLSYSFWMIITLVLFYWLQKLRFPFQIGSLVAIFIVGVLVWIPLYLLVDYIASSLIFDGTLGDIKNRFMTISGSVVFFYVVVYALTFAACLGIVLSEKTKLSAKANASLLQKQTASELLLSQQTMQLMQSQLSPHFLFNCLGAISGLARTAEKEQLISATARVGDLLRFIISNASANLITIEEELNFVDDYVALQKLRFGERFDFAVSLDLPETQTMCPPFTIQPLIENAFCHEPCIPFTKTAHDDLQLSPIELFLRFPFFAIPTNLYLCDPSLRSSVAFLAALVFLCCIH